MSQSAVNYSCLDALIRILHGLVRAREFDVPFRGSASDQGSKGPFRASIILDIIAAPSTNVEWSPPFLLHTPLLQRVANMSSTTTVTEAPAIVTVTQQPAITAENVLRLFPEVNTSLIGGSHNSATNDHALDGYDEEQIRLMDEVCIVLDNDDIPIGSATKKLCESAPT
jgi:hypothetical protein